MVNKQQPGKKIGRPAQFESRVQVATRLTAPVHQAIKDAAQKSGRSLSEEIEFRLERSIATEDALGGAHIANVARMVAANVALIESFMGASWTEDENVRAAVASGIGEMLRMYVHSSAPEGAERALRERAESLGTNIGSFLAEKPDEERVTSLLSTWDVLVERGKANE